MGRIEGNRDDVYKTPVRLALVLISIIFNFIAFLLIRHYTKSTSKNPKIIQASLALSIISLFLLIVGIYKAHISMGIMTYPLPSSGVKAIRFTFLILVVTFIFMISYVCLIYTKSPHSGTIHEAVKDLEIITLVIFCLICLTSISDAANVPGI